MPPSSDGRAAPGLRRPPGPWSTAPSVHNRRPGRDCSPGARAGGPCARPGPGRIWACRSALPTPRRCWPRWTTSSAPWPRRSGARCASWPAPGRARPAPSPTGSPTPWRWARPRRTTSWRSPSPPGPPVRCVSGCGTLGVGRVSARTFHAAALRLLQHFWPTVVGGGAPALLDHKAAVVGEAAARLGVRVDRSAVRDLSAELEWAKVGLLDPGHLPGCGRRRRPGRRRRSGRVAGGPPDRGLRGRQDRPRGASTSRTSCCSPSPCCASARTSPGRSAPGTGGSPSTSTRTSRPPSRRCSTRGWASGTTCAWSATPTRPSTPSPGPTPRCSRASPATHPGTHGRAPGPQLPVPAGRGGARQHGPRPDRRPAAAGRSGRRAIRTGMRRAPHLRPSTRTTWPRRRPSRDRVSALLAGGTPATDVAVLVRTNGQLEVSRRRWGPAGVPYLVRGGERFFSRREVREAVVLLRGAAKAAVRRVRSAASRRPSAVQPSCGAAVVAGRARGRRAVRRRLVAEPPVGRGQVRDRWESLAALVDHARRLTGAAARRRPARPGRRPRAPGGPAARPRAGGGDAGDHARREGAGVGRRAAARADRRAGADLPGRRRRPRCRRSAACSTSG